MGAQGFLKQLDFDEHLLKGIAAAREGRRGDARAILMEVVEREERNEQAWLWLAGVMDDPADVRTCLENVLELNPANARARQGLDWLNARYAGTNDDERETRTATDSQGRHSPAMADAAAPSHAAERTSRHGEHATVVSPAAPSHAELAPDVAEFPCPYCGAPTSERQHTCTQCRRSLLIQTEPPATPSRWLGMLAGVLATIGVLLALAVLAFGVAAVLAYQQARYGGANEVANAPIPLRLVTIAAGLLVIGAGALNLAPPLQRRSMPAYYGVVVALPLTMALAAFALLRGLPTQSMESVPSAAATALATSLAGGLIVLLALLALAAILAGLAYRDFFGPMVRFTARIDPADAATHYNSGVAYRKRDMWFMAVREWEQAVTKAPRDLNALRALSLAYAQLGRYEPARQTIARALQLAPDHTGLREDQEAVERQAAKAGRA